MTATNGWRDEVLNSWHLSFHLWAKIFIFLLFLFPLINLHSFCSMEGKINTKNKNATNDTVYEYIRTCISMPPRVNSATPWLRMDDSEMFPVNSLPVLQLQICVIFFGTLFFQTILCRLGIPRFTSMCIVSHRNSVNFLWHESII